MAWQKDKFLYHINISLLQHCNERRNQKKKVTKRKRNKKYYKTAKATK